jgi:hypothetical protein
MEWLLWIGGVGSVVYLGIGGIVAAMDTWETDDPFCWTLILRWPARVFFGKK